MERPDKFLSSLPLFASFSSQALADLVDQGQVRTLVPDEAIIRFGEPGRFLGVILDGEAEAVVTGPLGERRRLGRLKAGDFLGEMSLLTGEPTNADVVAVETCRVLLIPQDTFSRFVAINPGALQVLARTITARYRSRLEDLEAQASVEAARRSAPDPYGLQLSTANPARILVLNCGSSSLKFNYYDTAKEENNLEGMVERIGLANSGLVSSSRRGKTSRDLGTASYGQAFEAVLDLLTGPEQGVIAHPSELTAVGHRVVHGGEKYSSAVIIDDEVVADVDRNAVLAPLHNPPNLVVIKASRRLMPTVPQVAVFDTGFHQKMPAHAYLYGLPYELYQQQGIRRYGFHGISHHYVALRSAAHLKRRFEDLQIITCHLGNGASVCAIEHGRSIDTSMGLTPLEGLVMGTRCGDLDPSVVIHLCRQTGMSLDQVDNLLNRESGLKGLSGQSSDFRAVAEAAEGGDRRALLAVHVFCYRIRKYIGAYVAALGGLDALVFTGGIGEHSPWVRALACRELSYMGIEVDDVANATASPRTGEVADISVEGSRVRVLLVPTDEGRMIARETLQVLSHQSSRQVIKSQQERAIPVEISAHHVHLSREALEVLFGPAASLTPRTPLSQPGQFACEETVNLIGPHGRVEKVRVLGPLRDQTQVEISMTEEFRLGIKAPIRASGDLEGSPGVTLEGPKGRLTVPRGVICALRHIHMAPDDALYFGIKDRSEVLVRVEGERTLVFGDTLVRVHPDFRLAMHVDTDEANAAGLSPGTSGILLGVQTQG